MLTDHYPVTQALFLSGRLTDDITTALRDPNVLDPLLHTVDQRADAIILASVEAAATTSQGA